MAKTCLGSALELPESTCPAHCQHMPLWIHKQWLISIEVFGWEDIEVCVAPFFRTSQGLKSPLWKSFSTLYCLPVPLTPCQPQYTFLFCPSSTCSQTFVLPLVLGEPKQRWSSTFISTCMHILSFLRKDPWSLSDSKRTLPNISFSLSPCNSLLPQLSQYYPLTIEPIYRNF